MEASYTPLDCFVRGALSAARTAAAGKAAADEPASEPTVVALGERTLADTAGAAILVKLPAQPVVAARTTAERRVIGSARCTDVMARRFPAAERANGGDGRTVTAAR
jgi:hypothetical protein